MTLDAFSRVDLFPFRHHYSRQNIVILVYGGICFRLHKIPSLKYAWHGVVDLFLCFKQITMTL